MKPLISDLFDCKQVLVCASGDIAFEWYGYNAVHCLKKNATL